MPRERAAGRVSGTPAGTPAELLPRARNFKPEKENLLGRDSATTALGCPAAGRCCSALRHLRDRLDEASLVARLHTDGHAHLGRGGRAQAQPRVDSVAC